VKAEPTGRPAAGRAALEAWLAESSAWVEAALAAELDARAADWPAKLCEAVRYALLGGGKRLRPALVRLACQACGGRDADALPAAVALELVHTYSLVHDDLPCMDDDALRRGRPTCHVVFGEALAVLVGDALQSAAFEVLAEGGDARAVLVLARAAGGAGMVGGQVLDMTLDAHGADAADVAAVHARKTAALLSAAAELGARAAGASEARARALAAFGLGLGRLFQAVDDLLDVTGDAATLGKTPGKDQRAAKPTLVAALGLDGARREALRLREELEAELAELGHDEGGRLAALVDFVAARRS
jgi:geranylgeranyl pyrophosphate synthase